MNIRDDVKKSMSDKKLNSLSFFFGGGGQGGKTPIYFPYPTLILFTILSLFTVVIVVIDYNQLKYLLEFHYRLLYAQYCYVIMYQGQPLHSPQSDILRFFWSNH